MECLVPTQYCGKDGKDGKDSMDGTGADSFTKALVGVGPWRGYASTGHLTSTGSTRHIWNVFLFVDSMCSTWQDSRMFVTCHASSLRLWNVLRIRKDASLPRGYTEICSVWKFGYENHFLCHNLPWFIDELGLFWQCVRVIGRDFAADLVLLGCVVARLVKHNYTSPKGIIKCHGIYRAGNPRCTCVVTVAIAVTFLSSCFCPCSCSC